MDSKQTTRCSTRTGQEMCALVDISDKLAKLLRENRLSEGLDLLRRTRYDSLSLSLCRYLFLALTLTLSIPFSLDLFVLSDRITENHDKPIPIEIPDNPGWISPLMPVQFTSDFRVLVTGIATDSFTNFKAICAIVIATERPESFKLGESCELDRCIPLWKNECISRADGSFPKSSGGLLNRLSVHVTTHDSFVFRRARAGAIDSKHPDIIPFVPFVLTALCLAPDFTVEAVSAYIETRWPGPKWCPHMLSACLDFAKDVQIKFKYPNHRARELMLMPQTKFRKPVSVATSNSELEKEMTQSVVTLRFQVAIRDGDFMAAMASDATEMMDNTESLLPDPRDKNLMKLWARLRCKKEGDFHGVRSIFFALLQTGGGQFLNEIDPADGLFPLDVADQTQFECILNIHFNRRYANDVKSAQSPLHRVISKGWSIEWLRFAWDAADSNHFEQPHSETGSTPLHHACMKAKANSAQLWIEMVRYLVTKIGFVNPSHPCFTSHPITAPSEVVDLLGMARVKTKQYKTIHLPPQILSAIPTFLNELIAIVINYAL